MVFQKVSLSRLKIASKIRRIDPTKADFGRLLKVNINGICTCPACANIFIAVVVFVLTLPTAGGW